MTGRRLVVEADGGSRGNPGPAAWGALVRDGEHGPDGGEVLVELAESIGVATNNVAEYGGLVAGLRAAAEIDPDAQVLVRMDSKLVVEQMSGRWQIKHDAMKRLATEARSVLPPGQVRYEWVPRARNGHADRLANEAMDAAAEGRTWTAPAPRTATPDVAAAAEELREERTTMSTEEVTTTVATAGEAGAQAPARLAYRLLTGGDDRSFCEKVSAALADGYVLHGGPALTSVDGRVVAAQAVILPGAGHGGAA